MSVHNNVGRSLTKPNFILMAGLPGVGKSFIASKLARELGYALLDKDDILNFLKNSSIKDHLEQGRISYDILFQLVERQLAARVNTIVDTCFTFNWLRKRLYSYADKFEAVPIIIFCECSEDMAKKRIQARQEDNGKDFIDRSFAEHERIKEVFDPLSHIDITVNTELNINENIRSIISFINK